MALLTATSLATNTFTTVTISTAADVAGDTITWMPGKRRVLLVQNADASPITVTLTPQNASKKIDGDTFTVPTIAQAVAAAETRAIPITEAYANASNVVSVTYSAVANVTVRLVEISI